MPVNLPPRGTSATARQPLEKPSPADAAEPTLMTARRQSGISAIEIPPSWSRPPRRFEIHDGGNLNCVSPQREEGGHETSARCCALCGSAGRDSYDRNRQAHSREREGEGAKACARSRFGGVLGPGLPRPPQR